MRIKKILWASDGSKESRHALKWAELFATWFGASLSALSVIEIPEIGTVKIPADVNTKIALIEHDLVRRAENQLAHSVKILEPKGIRMETRVVRGIPHQEILKAARSHDFDLIAMGKQALNLWGRMLLGSTTTKVLREKHVPILTVRQDTSAPAVKKILVPISFSPGDTRSLEYAFELAGKLSATVYLLHIIQAHESWDKITEGFMGRLRELATHKLDAVLQSISAKSRRGVREIKRVKACRVGSGIVDFVRGTSDRSDRDEHAREKRSTAIVSGKYSRARDQGSSLSGHCRQAIVWERISVNLLYFIVGFIALSLFSVIVFPIIVAIFFVGLAGIVARVGRWKMIMEMSQV